MITFTPYAAEKIKEIMVEQSVPDHVMVRVGVKGGGCSGFTYTFEFDGKKGRFDVEFESNGIKIVVDKKSHMYINGTEVDWSDSLMDRGLKFNNPSAKGSCGCKTSFMYEPPKEEQQSTDNPWS